MRINTMPVVGVYKPRDNSTAHLANFRFRIAKNRRHSLVQVNVAPLHSVVDEQNAGKSVRNSFNELVRLLQLKGRAPGLGDISNDTEVLVFSTEHNPGF